jgi:anti-sigma regulatory factor (Ser/Thr protein kinase)
MKDRFELEIDGELENLAMIGDFIADSMREFGLDDRKVFEVQMAVDEACTNIIKYGYAGKKGTIEISCLKRDEDVVVVIKDTGKPFDPTSVQLPDLDAGLEERKIGGLGVYFMKTLMDEVKYKYRDGKNVLRLVVRKGVI